MTTSLDKALGVSVKDLIGDLVTEKMTFEIDVEDYSASTGKTTTVKRRFQAKASPPQEYDSRYINGDSIQAGDSSIFLAGKDLKFIPKKGMVVIERDQRWRSVRVRKHRSGDDIAAWEIQLRHQ